MSSQDEKEEYKSEYNNIHLMKQIKLYNLLGKRLPKQDINNQTELAQTKTDTGTSQQNKVAFIMTQFSYRQCHRYNVISEGEGRV